MSADYSLEALERKVAAIRDALIRVTVLRRLDELKAQVDDRWGSPLKFWLKQFVVVERDDHAATGPLINFRTWMQWTSSSRAAREVLQLRQNPYPPSYHPQDYVPRENDDEPLPAPESPSGFAWHDLGTSQAHAHSHSRSQRSLRALGHRQQHYYGRRYAHGGQF
ncbi:hypothetical protein JCM10207_005862 [Rhodosporidiobolus poonsookiae]